MLQKVDIKHIFNIPARSRLSDTDYLSRRSFVQGLLIGSGFEAKCWPDWLDFRRHVHEVHGGSPNMEALYLHWLAAEKEEWPMMGKVPGAVIFDDFRTDESASVPDSPYIRRPHSRA